MDSIVENSNKNRQELSVSDFSGWRSQQRRCAWVRRRRALHFCSSPTRRQIWCCPPLWCSCASSAGGVLGDAVANGRSVSDRPVAPLHALVATPTRALPPRPDGLGASVSRTSARQSFAGKGHQIKARAPLPRACGHSRAVADRCEPISDDVTPARSLADPRDFGGLIAFMPRSISASRAAQASRAARRSAK